MCTQNTSSEDRPRRPPQDRHLQTHRALRPASAMNLEIKKGQLLLKIPQIILLHRFLLYGFAKSGNKTFKIKHLLLGFLLKMRFQMKSASFFMQFKNSYTQHEMIN
jgi:hypothetical protein